MGDFKIIINAVGGHGQDRSKKDGEIINFNEGGEYTPEAITKRFLDEMLKAGISIQSATITHWPAENYPTDRIEGCEVVDDLLTGIRKNSF